MHDTKNCVPSACGLSQPHRSVARDSSSSGATGARIGSRSESSRDHFVANAWFRAIRSASSAARSCISHSGQRSMIVSPSEMTQFVLSHTTLAPLRRASIPANSTTLIPRSLTRGRLRVWTRACCVKLFHGRSIGENALLSRTLAADSARPVNRIHVNVSHCATPVSIFATRALQVCRKQRGRASPEY